jgi:hypothetical protein
MDSRFVQSRPGGARRIDSRWTEPRTPALWGFNDLRPFPRALYRERHVICKHFPWDSRPQRCLRRTGNPVGIAISVPVAWYGRSADTATPAARFLAAVQSPAGAAYELSCTAAVGDDVGAAGSNSR